MFWWNMFDEELWNSSTLQFQFFIWIKKLLLKHPTTKTACDESLFIKSRGPVTLNRLAVIFCVSIRVTERKEQIEK